MLEQIIDILLQLSGCTDNTCPGSAFTAVGAAFATQGYYLVSQIVSAIGAGKMEYWAVFIYIFSFFATIVMIVLNGLHVPKNIMWFALGPALFVWLVYSGEDVKGVMWRIGNDKSLNQEKVWEIAEPGLRNLRPIKKGDLRQTKGEEAKVSKEDIEANIRVPWLFVHWDSLISDTVAQLASWVGADRMLAGSGKSNLGNTEVKLKSSSASTTDGTAAILSNLKWSKLQGIVGARITTSGLRDSFVEFMSGNCGKALKENIDERKLINARKSPLSFLNAKDDIGIFKNTSNYKKILNSLKSESTIVQGSLKRMLTKCATKSSSGGTSLCDFLQQTAEDSYKKYQTPEFDVINCQESFNLIMQALRWETGQIYHKIMADWDNGKSSKEKEILVAFYYGWNIDMGASEWASSSGRLADDNLKYFTRDLIFSYLLRNELEYVPNITNVQYSTKVQAEQASDAHIQALGSQNKYGEIYTWARMMPYVQGILMFILAGAYPIVCIVFLIPGMHKIIITWAAFWAWVKFWDLGFAIVTVIERSVWGMIGNSEHASAVNQTIASLYGNFSSSGIPNIDVTCNSGSLGSCAFPTIQSITDMDAPGLFDKGTAIGLSLNYGVFNGYYIYIMAALYMAVPVICGQVFLQGKHGVNQLYGMISGGAERAAGGAAEASAKSQMAADAQNTVGIADRTVKANAAQDFAIRAMEASNTAAEYGLDKATRSSAMQGRNLIARAEELAASNHENNSRLLKNSNAPFASMLHALNENPQSWPIVAGIAGNYGAGNVLNRIFGGLDEEQNNAMAILENPESTPEQKQAALESLAKFAQETTSPTGAQGMLPPTGGAEGALPPTGAEAPIMNPDGSVIPVPNNGFANNSQLAFDGGIGGGAGIGGNSKIATWLEKFRGMGWFAISGLAGVPGDFAAVKGNEVTRTDVNPLKRDNLGYESAINAQNFGSDSGSMLQKGYADRMETMAKYAGDVAGYEMKQDLAMSNQHLAGVFGVNLMPQQKPYDIKGMMGSGEIVSNGKNAKSTFAYFGDEEAGGDFGKLVTNSQGVVNSTVLAGNFDILQKATGVDEQGHVKYNDNRQAEFTGGTPIVAGKANKLLNETINKPATTSASQGSSTAGATFLESFYGPVFGQTIDHFVGKSSDQKNQGTNNDKDKK